MTLDNHHAQVQSSKKAQNIILISITILAIVAMSMFGIWSVNQMTKDNLTVEKDLINARWDMVMYEASGMSFSESDYDSNTGCFTMTSTVDDTGYGTSSFGYLHGQYTEKLSNHSITKSLCSNYYKSVSDMKIKVNKDLESLN